MNYAFLADFDLLRSQYSHRDITAAPWAVQSNRETANKFHKILRAREEIVRLNVECRRLHTHIYAEHRTFTTAIAELRERNPPLAVELQDLYSRRLQVNRVHFMRLKMIYALTGFTGWSTPGLCLAQTAATPNEDVAMLDAPHPATNVAPPRPSHESSTTNATTEDEMNILAQTLNVDI